MTNQIYHTSHCGSTLLAYMLSNNCFVYNEPEWVVMMTSGGQDKMFMYDESQVIKFTSYHTNLAKRFEGKKVFIYRNLEDHLEWLSRNNHNYLIEEKQWPVDYLLKNSHKSVKHLIEKCDTDLKKFAFMWGNAFALIKEARDVMYINSKDFFLDKEGIVKKVLSHFNIEEKEKTYDVNTYVKDIRILGEDLNNNPMTKIDCQNDVADDYGIVTEISNEVKEISEWWNEHNRR